MSNFADKDLLVEALLQERDELYLELSRLRDIAGGTRERQLDEMIRQKDAELRAKDDILRKKDTVIQKKDDKIQEKEEQIRKLTDQLAWYRHKFWKPSSEKYIPQDPNQRVIDFEGLDVLPQEEEAIKQAQTEIVTYERKKPDREKKQPVRLPLPEDLRREEETIEPEGIDQDWVRIGEEVTEVLEYKPGEMYVRRIIRPKYARKAGNQVNQSGNDNNKEALVRVAALPVLPLPRSNAGASLLAELLMGKYLFHLPFHRQRAIFRLAGFSPPGSTVNGWFQGAGDLLRAMYYRLREVVLSCDYIQVDESTVPVINDEKHRAVKAYMWMVRSVMDNLVFFHYDKGSRAQKVVVELLKDFKGAVQSDGYQAYSIYENKKGVLLLSCWSHARRKFSEALKKDQKGAGYALDQISLLYKVETMADDQNMDYTQRAELRKRLAYPVLCAFEKWIVSYYPKVFPKGRMGKALSYTYSLFHRLSRYHLDGRYKLDTNLAENALRDLSLGRKNFMFCGNHEAAENAAIMYSLLGCCKTCGVNPREWLTDVLTRIPVYNNDYSLDLADLLPHNWKASKNGLKSSTDSDNYQELSEKSANQCHF